MVLRDNVRDDNAASAIPAAQAAGEYLRIRSLL
jgi:hypothetical protein